MRNKSGKCEYSRIARLVIKIYKQNMINLLWFLPLTSILFYMCTCIIKTTTKYNNIMTGLFVIEDKYGQFVIETMRQTWSFRYYSYNACRLSRFENKFYFSAGYLYLSMDRKQKFTDANIRSKL